MKLRVVSVIGMLGLALGLASQIPDAAVFAQGAAESKSAEKKGADGRVPAYFAQIGLSKDQRAKVLEVQSSYAEKIDALRKQIADLEAKRDVDVRGVLSDDQKKKLDELVDAAKKKAAESRTKGKPAESGKGGAEKKAEPK